ncbi:LacI family DNA-binding transcriptional regulator [Mycobacterium neglectum]|uniref:LacI family DNA-binding transcriptional regulator n=1 Tax=Mycobacterium neglectum TaxID=242737 RepID=UPI001FE44F69|nr:LacI family DNA-binding transcriptional regulator [Mycobacterium neglectum]
MTPDPASRRPVMADVARLAGVSHQTVSRVINGSSNIKPATRSRVEHAIAALGYRPNTAARALVTRRSKTIGIIASNTSQHGPASIQHSLQEAARAAGYFSSVVTLSAVTHEELRDALDYLDRQSVEAIVMIATQHDALAVVRAETTSTPLVVVEGELSGRGLSVGVDQMAGARLATEHLVELGHRRIVHVSGPRSWTEARARHAGYVDVMHAAGLPVDTDFEGDWSPSCGYEIGRRLASRADFTAVFAANDQMAMGVLHAFVQSGLRVPQDVSLVGFDDIPESAYTNPSLTTIHQDFHLVGQRAIDVVTAILNGVSMATPLIPPELVIRGSTCGPAPERQKGHTT